MTVPRRRIIRPVPTEPHQGAGRRQIDRLRGRLDTERAALARWQTRMRRAFNACTKCQQRIARLERQLTRLEGR